jgi:DNA-binding MarR family transcriptional regulator
VTGPSTGAGPPDGRAANVLGALAVALVDRLSEATGDAAGHSPSAAAALSALHHFLDGPSIDLLRQVLGLTSSGTVRLIDRLETEGCVTRRPGLDGRSVAISLTPSGRRAAARVTAARGRVLEHSLEALSPTERETLDKLSSKVLVGLMRGPGATRWICRLCDSRACGHNAGWCPVAAEARTRYLSAGDEGGPPDAGS